VPALALSAVAALGPGAAGGELPDAESEHADELKLDPSCTRARRYAERWGYGALIVTNIFGWRATDPAQMKAVRDPVGRGNNRAILRAARESQLVVCAWGNHGAHLGRSQHVLALLRSAGVPLHALRVNGAGEPAHPLYLPGNIQAKRIRGQDRN